MIAHCRDEKKKIIMQIFKTRHHLFSTLFTHQNFASVLRRIFFVNERASGQTPPLQPFCPKNSICENIKTINAGWNIAKKPQIASLKNCRFCATALLPSCACLCAFLSSIHLPQRGSTGGLCFPCAAKVGCEQQSGHRICIVEKRKKKKLWIARVASIVCPLNNFWLSH